MSELTPLIIHRINPQSRLLRFFRLDSYYVPKTFYFFAILHFLSEIATYSLRYIYGAEPVENRRRIILLMFVQLFVNLACLSALCYFYAVYRAFLKFTTSTAHYFTALALSLLLFLNLLDVLLSGSDQLFPLLQLYINLFAYSFQLGIFTLSFKYCSHFKLHRPPSLLHRAVTFTQQAESQINQLWKISSTFSTYFTSSLNSSSSSLNSSSLNSSPPYSAAYSPAQSLHPSADDLRRFLTELLSSTPIPPDHDVPLHLDDLEVRARLSPDHASVAVLSVSPRDDRLASFPAATDYSAQRAADERPFEVSTEDAAALSEWPEPPDAILKTGSFFLLFLQAGFLLAVLLINLINEVPQSVLSGTLPFAQTQTENLLLFLLLNSNLSQLTYFLHTLVPRWVNLRLRFIDPREEERYKRDVFLVAILPSPADPDTPNHFANLIDLFRSCSCQTRQEIRQKRPDIVAQMIVWSARLQMKVAQDKHKERRMQSTGHHHAQLYSSDEDDDVDDDDPYSSHHEI